MWLIGSVYKTLVKLSADGASTSVALDDAQPFQHKLYDVYVAYQTLGQTIPRTAASRHRPLTS